MKILLLFIILAIMLTGFFPDYGLIIALGAIIVGAIIRGLWLNLTVSGKRSDNKMLAKQLREMNAELDALRKEMFD